MIAWLNYNPAAARCIFIGVSLVIAIVLVIKSPEDWY